MRIGTSGWQYAHWRGCFYPEGLRRRDELGYAAERFDTLEINRSFYGLIPTSTWRRWYDETPRGFVYAVKGSRYITHNKRLMEPETPLANFFASGVLELDEKLGPILWQLPKTMRFDSDRLARFFTALPKDTESAVRLAKSHDSRVREPAYGSGANHRIRHAFEFRHESFLNDDLAKMARKHGVALAFSHSSRWPYVEQVTAGFVYLRLHGPEQLYASSYNGHLDWWSSRIVTWASGASIGEGLEFSQLRAPSRKGRDVYVYFDNDYRGYATEDALALRRMCNRS